MFGVSTETSRKFLHVSGGFLALSSPLFFTSHWWVLMLCSLAFLLLLFTYIKHWLPSIHQTRRKSIGSVIYPIPIYLCFLIASQKNNTLLFYLPISLLTISDTIAELGGRRWGTASGSLMNSQKTVAGSISFAISALVISIAWQMKSNDSLVQISFISLMITVIATVTEMVSTRGLDNITVPLSTLACLLLF
jgi:phytol kinase